MHLLVSACLTLWLASAALVSAQSPVIRSEAEREMFNAEIFRGTRLRAAEVAGIETILEKVPDSLQDRLKLLGFYYVNRRNAVYAEARKRNILWIIEKHPAFFVAGLPHAQFDFRTEAPAYESGKKLWLKHLDASLENAAVLENAAKYIRVEEPAFAEKLLKQGEALLPFDSVWTIELGNLYLNWPNSSSRTELAAKAVVALERAVLLGPPASSKAIVVSNLAEASLDSREWDKAQRHALQAVSLQDGFAVHSGNWILGELALRIDDVALATSYLLASGKASGSSALNAAGPRMRLARQLLERGQRDAVLAYFEACASFWVSGRDRLAEWAATVRAGGTPDFGANGR